MKPAGGKTERPQSHTPGTGCKKNGSKTLAKLIFTNARTIIVKNNMKNVFLTGPLNCYIYCAGHIRKRLIALSQNIRKKSVSYGHDPLL